MGRWHPCCATPLRTSCCRCCCCSSRRLPSKPRPMRRKKPERFRMPPRSRLSTNAVAAATSDSEHAGAARVAVPMPSGIAWPIMKRYQALFILVAHAEVRSRGDAGKLSVKEQEAVILESYKNHVRLWYRDDADLQNSSPNFPQCPQALKRVGGGTEDDILNCMLSTTQTGNNAFTGASLLRKAGSLKTDF